MNANEQALRDLADHPGETITKGRKGLLEQLAEYFRMADRAIQQPALEISQADLANVKAARHSLSKHAERNQAARQGDTSAALA